MSTGQSLLIEDEDRQSRIKALGDFHGRKLKHHQLIKRCINTVHETRKRKQQPRLLGRIALVDLKPIIVINGTTDARTDERVTVKGLTVCAICGCRVKTLEQTIYCS